MKKEIGHGFTTRDEWEEAFKVYFDKIVDLDHKNHDLLITRQDCESWIAEFKKQAEIIRNAYLEIDQFKHDHIFYYTKHPENWIDEVADSLTAYLYRFWYCAEDVEIVYECVTTLQSYYESKNDEIQIMKCKLVLLTCYHFLDETHFKDASLLLCKEIHELITTYYDELSEEDLSMALSVYDIQSNIRYDNLKITPDFEQFFDQVLFPEYIQATTMLKRFLKTADMSLKINASLPQILKNTERMFASISLYIHKDVLREDQLEIVCKKATELWQSRDENFFGRTEDMVSYYMANRFSMGLSNREVLDRCIEELRKLEDYYNEDRLVDDVVNTGESIAIMINTLCQEEDSFLAIGGILLNNYMEYLLSLPYGKVMTYIVDQTVYRHIVPLLRYLNNENDIFEVLLELTTFRQVQTAVHSLMVGKSACLILKYIIEKKPEILLEIPEFETIKDVEDNADEILDFIYRASLVHDVGKILCTNEINMQYRPITDIEFKTIKFHPTSSSEILNAIPQLNKYHDIATGHHKSFDGAFGYPEWFNNVQSKQKLFIDLIRICDSLDAATDTFGRLYAEPKSFYTVLGEFVAMKGTSYSDVLVDFISEQPDLQKELDELMRLGREDVYRDIYSIIRKEKHPSKNKVKYRI